MSGGVSGSYISISSQLKDSAVTEAKLAAEACSAAKMKKEGTATHVLTSNGAGAVPSYQAVSSGVPDVSTYMEVVFGKTGFSPTSADLVTGTEVSGAASMTYDQDTNLRWRLQHNTNHVVFRVHFSAKSCSGVVIYHNNADAVALSNIKVETSPDNTNWTSKYDNAVTYAGQALGIFVLTWAAVASTTDLRIDLTTGNTNSCGVYEVIGLVG
jgi:hypothetical protein